MSPKEALQDAYKRLEPYSFKQRWEFKNNLVHLSFLIKFLPREGRILDAGSYIAILAFALKSLGYDIEAADKYLFLPSNDYAIANLDNLKHVWASNNLKVTSKDLTGDVLDDMYDAVISIAVIEHQRYPKNFIENLTSHINKGGVLYIATPNATNFMNRFRVFFGRAPMSNIDAFYKEGQDFNGHWREYTLKELKAMFALSNVEIIKAVTCQSLPPDWKKKRKFFLNVTRIIANIFPRLGDTNIIIGRAH